VVATLIITEKYKAAEAIAGAFGKASLIEKNKFIKIFFIPMKNMYILPLRGHLLDYRNTQSFKSWTNPPPREIITNSNAINKFPLKYANHYINALKQYAKKCTKSIIATDADIEGCNIGIFDALPFIKKANPSISVMQLWLSSLQQHEILSKFQNLIKPKISWAESAEARAIIDAIIGFSASREVTNTFKPLLIKYKIHFTSIGRVQTSLLYLIYLKEKEIIDFVPESYFNIEATLVYEKTSFKAHHESNPFPKNKETLARNIYQTIKNEKSAAIIDNSRKVLKRAPPRPLNTSKALILLTKNLKISAKTALSTMNELYLNKLITYPRTDTDVYSSNFDHFTILKKLASNTIYGGYTQNLLNGRKTSPTKGKMNAQDHPPITPIDSVDLKDPIFKNQTQQKVYDMLTRHYLALFGDPATESQQVLKLSIKGEIFISNLISLIVPGFLEIAPFLKPHYQNILQIQGTAIPIKQIDFLDKKTQSSPRYTDSTLLKLMESNNLGTKSTRPLIIKLLETRKLIKRVKTKYFLTELGYYLMENLVEIWLPFLKPDFTKKVEVQLELIKEQKKGMNEVIKEVKQEFLDLFDRLLAEKIKLNVNCMTFDTKSLNLPISLMQGSKTIDTVISCPQCGNKTMKMIQNQKNKFLLCSKPECKKFIPLPKKGIISVLDSNCQICGFNAFKVSIIKYGKPYVYHFCPNCWHQGLIDTNGKGFCSQCSLYKIANGKCIKK
jgi:DNA topoisomerase IA/ssDNA-binding Zn-finger/Zn-ribbon topoisomerase 1